MKFKIWYMLCIMFLFSCTTDEIVYNVHYLYQQQPNVEVQTEAGWLAWNDKSIYVLIMEFVNKDTMDIAIEACLIVYDSLYKEPISRTCNYWLSHYIDFSGLNSAIPPEESQVMINRFQWLTPEDLAYTVVFSNFIKYSEAQWVFYGVKYYIESEEEPIWELNERHNIKRLHMFPRENVDD